ncbi:hypothetical protein LTR36_010396 [Oleoguttula mirabilis]|uniref:LisH domain-containing protein n=1 Tax=Oleoguttula mirabilis TaxID=1507867 RepID=A0AAV9J514_9PEZI|nr:hypothetical protein LTR36_010396 [Oleoguttula mirabilis]
MSQPPQQPMSMAGMGGPVGAPQQMNAGTPNSGGAAIDSIKRLNTAIYDYLLRNGLYDSARTFVANMEVEIDADKKSPNPRGPGQQSNGVDAGMDVDSEIKNRPDDLPAPLHLGNGPFLQDWWCQFWEIFHGNRGKGKQSTLNYIGAQRQAQKARTSMVGGGNMDPASMQNMRGYNNMMQMNNGMAMPNDLKRAAMQNQRNLTPQQMQQMKTMQAQNQQMMQGQQMERQGSQMDMSGPRSGSPGSGEDPSPHNPNKRPRLEGQMNPNRQGPPGQMQGNQVGAPLANLPPTDPALYAQTQELLRAKGIDPNQMAPAQLHNLAMQPANYQAKAVEAYSSSIQQTMKAAMNQASSNNMSKGMPPNAAMGPGGAQGSPMSQATMNGGNEEFYQATNGGRMGMPNAAAAAAGGAANNGNHALQDYQMQLMLLEQQNKKRLLMARQEQDSMTHPAGVPGPNGQFAPGMSPQGSRAGDPSPNPNDMQRGTPKIGKAGMSPNGDMAGRGSPQPGMMGPNMNMNTNMPPELRQQMMQNGQMMRPPSSHPMVQQMTGEQVRMFAAQQQAGLQQMQNGAWQPGQGPPPGQMMPGQLPGGPGQPQPSNMTPRQGNQPMPPPPPPNASGTQPSSPAQPAAPPTPSQSSKPKPGSKKAEQAKKAAAKKAGANATPAPESEAPPTPTPATPITPMHVNSFGHAQNKQLPNGQQLPGQQPMQNGGLPGGPQAGQASMQQPHQQPPPPPSQDPNQQPFGNLNNDDFPMNMNMDFANLDGGDVLDNFDFDSFLNTGDGDGMSGFDANFAFGGGELEAGGELGGP